MAKIKNVELTDKQRKKLNSFLPVKVDGTFKYVPKIYREVYEEKDWPVFILKPMTGTEALRTSDLMTGEFSVEEDGKSKTTIQRGSYVVEVCHKGVVGWSNYKDDKGKMIGYDKELDVLPSALMDDLCNAITEHTTLTEEELLGLE